MSRIKIITAALIAAFVLTALAAGPASANDSWFVNGTALTGSQTASVATLAVTDASPVLAVPQLPLKIGCQGHLEWVSLKVTAPDLFSANSLAFAECAVVEPSTCELAEPEISTEKIEGLADLAIGIAVRLLFKTPALHLAEFELVGSSCSIAGKKAVTGTVALKVPTGQTETTIQALEGLGSLEQGTDVLETANDQSYIEGGKALLKLESGSKWSFH
jgi:hypothetical protein